MAKNILKKTNKKVAVKIAGNAANDTISLNVDCKHADETLGSTQRVSIQSVKWTGAADAIATITRNSVVIMVLQANAASVLDFTDAEYNENIQSDQNIVVTTSGEMAVYLVLRKESGYTLADPQQYTALPY
jgi:UDP-N-acetylglucosamine transferase subunit ALG13